MAELRRAFVCGHPIAHSRSPLIHGYWLRRHGISGSYLPVDVKPEDFGAFLRRLPESGYLGGNITIPHKEAACGAVSRIDEAARLIGAVNTLWLERGELAGGNTDAAGFAANLDEFAPQWRHAGTALVIGAGGAARAVIFSLLEAGFVHVHVVNRTAGRGRELAERFGPRVSGHPLAAAGELIGEAGLIVNTTAAGMDGSEALDLDFARARDDAIATDIVYVPLATEFLRRAEERGLGTVDGLGMLLHQAAPGFERWFGPRPAVTAELRALVIADLERN